MLQATCAATPAQNADGSLSCSSGWVFVEYAVPFFGSITIAEAETIASGVITVWVIAWGLNLLARQAFNRR